MFFEEAGAGDCGYADFSGQPFAEIEVAAAVGEGGDVDHYVVGALGGGVAEAGFVKAAEEDVPLFGVEVS